MALEGVVFPVQDPLTSYNCCSKEYTLYSNSAIVSSTFGMNYEFANYSSMLLEEDNHKILNDYDFPHPNNTSTTPTSDILVNQWDHHQQHQQQQQCVYSNYSSPKEYLCSEAPPPIAATKRLAAEVVAVGGARRKRRRRSCKNKEEVEQQRMTHIAVERNRRKQMNEYLAVIRSLMPSSYVQRGDQASIVAGAINYVKELEQMLQSMEAQKLNKTHNKEHQQEEQDQEKSQASSQGDGDNSNVGNVDAPPEKIATQTQPQPQPQPRPRPPVFADFFSFPQYSTRSNQAESSKSARGEIEVTMVDSHANVKVLAKKQPKQLVKLIAGFQGLRLNVLHLNVTTLDSYVLYSVSLRAEEGCQLNSVDDIAAAANHILGQIQEEAAISL